MAMNQITFGLDLGDRVITDLGDQGVVTFKGHGSSGVEYCVRTSTQNGWLKESEVVSLYPLPILETK